jgi:hypothetical protein
MAMTFYTGWQYLLIDAATQFGHDKMLFEDRIQWAEDHLHELESLADQAETKPLYMKAVMAIRKAQQGSPTGHLVGVDGCCSGIQMMSVLTGCISGARATGLVDPNRRADAYTECTAAMNVVLQGQINVSRKDAKAALMTSFYGSKAKPKEIFGDDTPELKAFYEAAQTIAPGPWELLQDLLASWQPYALQHAWVMPDGFDARIKVMTKKEARIEVDELNHATFTYEYYDNEGSKSGLSNAANVTHSVDAYVLREMHRRCNYNRAQTEYARDCIQAELIERHLSGDKDRDADEHLTPAIHRYRDHYARSTLASAVILPHLDEATVTCLSTEQLQALSAMANAMLQYQPFPLVTIHDEFKAHPNNVNWVRWNYKEILADIADSNLLDDILTQIWRVKASFPKLSNQLSSLVRESNYGLC